MFWIYIQCCLVSQQNHNTLTIRGWGGGGSTLIISLTVKIPFFLTTSLKLFLKFPFHNVSTNWLWSSFWKLGLCGRRRCVVKVSSFHWVVCIAICQPWSVESETVSCHLPFRLSWVHLDFAISTRFQLVPWGPHIVSGEKPHESTHSCTLLWRQD